MAAIKPPMSKLTDKANSQTGTPKGRRTIITMGEVKGMMLNQNAIAPSGSSITLVVATIPKIKGIVTGSINCWVSVSLSTAEPIAAKRAAYSNTSS